MKRGLAWAAAALASVPILSFAAPAPNRPAPSFSRDVAPVFRTRCVACHMTGEEPGRMALTPVRAYETLVGVRATTLAMQRVEPGWPDRSYLLLKLRGDHLKAGGKGARMPLGAVPLPEDTIAGIERWIRAGAPRN